MATDDDLVTLAEVKTGLKFDADTADDARLEAFITAASLSILRFLKNDNGEEWRETGDGPIATGNVPQDIKVATIMLVGIMDENPDGNDSGIYERGWLPEPVESLLHSRREPTLA